MRIVTVLAAAILASSSTASAADSGFALGARASVGFPVGDVMKDTPLSSGISVMIPLQVDAGYRFGRNHFVGAYFQYGFGITKNCAVGDSCSATDVRLGLQYTYTFNPDASTFWLGLGTGWEWLTAKTDLLGSGTLSGWEWANVQLGYDFRLGSVTRLGPWAGLTISQFGTASSGGNSVSIPSTAVHLWPMFGIRGMWEL